MEFDEIYFWTATINQWRKLLEAEEFKQVIIDSLDFLSAQKKIAVYGFVVMPNHVHIIWEMLELNGKEKPYASFLKYTGHQFLNLLRMRSHINAEDYLVDEETRKHRFWNRDPLAIRILDENMLLQKLEYCHNNPLQSHWNLVKQPEDYLYSSAGYYLKKTQRFAFLKHYGNRI